MATTTTTDLIFGVIRKES